MPAKNNPQSTPTRTISLGWYLGIAGLTAALTAGLLLTNVSTGTIADTAYALWWVAQALVLAAALRFTWDLTHGKRDTAVTLGWIVAVLATIISILFRVLETALENWSL